MKKTVLNNCVPYYRQQHGLTQAELADHVGVTRQTIIAIEKGNYEPSVRLALQLAALLAVPVEKLFYEDNI